MGRTARNRLRKLKLPKPENIANCSELIELCKWMHKSGWKPVARLRPAVFPSTGRGLMALSHLKPDDLIVQIPYKLLVTRERVLREIPELSSQSTTAELLTLFLVHCHKNQLQTAYLKTVPTEYSVAALCSSEEINILPIALKCKVAASKEYIRHKYEKLFKMSKSLLDQNLTYDLFTWAWFSVNTRAVYYKDQATGSSSSTENNMALAPYLDLMNHHSTAVVEANFNRDTRCYEIRTKQKISRFHQVFISYGPHDNLKLYLEYGFIVQANIHSAVEITLQDISNLKKAIEGVKEADALILSELSKNFYCHRDGLSWNVKIALTLLSRGHIYASKFKLRPYDIIPDEASIKNLELQLIRMKIGQLKADAVAPIDQSPSYQVARMLIEDMLSVLNHALYATGGQ